MARTLCMNIFFMSIFMYELINKKLLILTFHILSNHIIIMVNISIMNNVNNSLSLMLYYSLE